MDKTTLSSACMAALDLGGASGSGSGSGAPQWVHLLPAGRVDTLDRRGPYRVKNPKAMIEASFATHSRLPIDENHATDLAAPKGQPAPAHGWIVAMEAREDGIWGKVEWTETGRQLVEGRAYRGLSPVIAYDRSRNIRAIMRASLVNNPNLRGLTALHQQQESTMDWMEFLKDLLGLGADATDDQIKAAARKRLGDMEDGEGGGEALQAQLSQIGAALGLSGEADQAAILAAIAARGDGAEDEGAGGVASHAATETITALQSELAGLTAQLNAVEEARARDLAERFIDEEIRRGRVGVKPLRDHYIARHMSDPESVETEIAALPVLEAGRMTMTRAPAEDGKVALNAAEQEAARLIGVDPKDYAKALAAERKHEEAL